MKEMRSERVISICDEFSDKGCRKVCPLRDACVMKHGDTRELFSERLNMAARAIDAAALKNTPVDTPNLGAGPWFDEFNGQEQSI